MTAAMKVIACAPLGLVELILRMVFLLVFSVGTCFIGLLILDDADGVLNVLEPRLWECLR